MTKCFWGATLKEHDVRVRNVSLRNSGLTLNASKCEFAVSQIRFLGHIITSTGGSANPDVIQGLNDFKTPTSVSDVRSFLGMANQLSKVFHKLREFSQPMRDILCANADWCWGKHSREPFVLSKPNCQCPLKSLFIIQTNTLLYRQMLVDTLSELRCLRFSLTELSEWCVQHLGR